jgi:hypothetical protein
LRGDAILPFGRGLASDPHTWTLKETEDGYGCVAQRLGTFPLGSMAAQERS